MNPERKEVVRIGVGPAVITRVTRDQVEYIDDAGKPCSIGLQQCAQNWVMHFIEQRDNIITLPGATEESIDRWNAGCVGRRSAVSDPPWVEFMDERRARFEFKNYEAIYALLLTPLMKAGWHTFDAD